MRLHGSVSTKSKLIFAPGISIVSVQSLESFTDLAFCATIFARLPFFTILNPCLFILHLVVYLASSSSYWLFLSGILSKFPFVPFQQIALIKCILTILHTYLLCCSFQILIKLEIDNHVLREFNLSIFINTLISVTGCVCLSVSRSPPKPLDQSKNVTVRTFHIWSGIVHEHIFLAKSCQKVPKNAKRPFSL